VSSIELDVKLPELTIQQPEVPKARLDKHLSWRDQTAGLGGQRRLHFTRAPCNHEPRIEYNTAFSPFSTIIL
jgi:hypothetical protein